MFTLQDGHRMNEMRTTAIDDPVAWASNICLSVTRANVLTYYPDGAGHCDAAIIPLLSPRGSMRGIEITGPFSDAGMSGLINRLGSRDIGMPGLQSLFIQYLSLEFMQSL